MSGVSAKELSQRFGVLGQVWSGSEATFQDALAVVYRDRQTIERPRCLCTPTGVEMYVARHQQELVLKRMPDTGAQHHAACASFEPDVKESGLGELVGEAVMEADFGRIEVRVNFPLTRTDSRAVARVARHEGQVVREASRSMSLKALVHLLFHRAGFDRWSPAMQGKRNQWVVHKYLMQAATGLLVKGTELSNRLYVPEQFSETTRIQTASRRREKLSFLFPRDGTRPLAMMIGEFKLTDVFAGQRRVWIRHMPDAPLIVNDRTWTRIEKTFASHFEAQHVDSEDKPRLILTALIRARSEYLYEIDSATLMMTTIDWIPIEGLHELSLFKHLCSTGRRFLKPLRFDAATERVFPSALLLDSGISPVPIYTMTEFMTEKQQKATRKKVEKERRNLQLWDSTKLVGSLNDLY